MTCSADYVVTPADVASGQIVNTATAHAGGEVGVVSDPSTATVEAATDPAPLAPSTPLCSASRRRPARARAPDPPSPPAARSPSPARTSCSWSSPRCWPWESASPSWAARAPRPDVGVLEDDDPTRASIPSLLVMTILVMAVLAVAGCGGKGDDATAAPASGAGTSVDTGRVSPADLVTAPDLDHRKARSET